MIGNDQWTRYIHTLDVNSNKKVKKIEVNAMADKVEGTVHFTDLQFQEGRMTSALVPNTQDILTPVEFNIDEWKFLNTVDNAVKIGEQPVLHENVRNRFFNIIGRGHEVISIPNVFHEDYTFPLVTTGLDLSLKAKEDFDLLRIRTNDGGYVEGRTYEGVPQLEDHPLNYKYTREFYFGSGKAGESIDLKVTINAARIGGKNVPLKQHSINIAGTKMKIDRQRFMLAPAGSFRIGLEFYKKSTETFTNEYGEKKTVTYLKDTGIGYHGITELNQWTYGVSKL